MSESDIGFQAALSEAKKGAEEGGIPIGACLVDRDGKILGQGHNMRLQKGSAILHVCSLSIYERVFPCHRNHPRSYILYKGLTRLRQAEMSALESAGRLPASAYKGSTMYTTLSPCSMCTGACILYNVFRVVLGENKTFQGGEDLLRSNGIEVVNLQSAEAEKLVQTFISDRPEDWCFPIRRSSV